MFKCSALKQAEVLAHMDSQHDAACCVVTHLCINSTPYCSVMLALTT